MEIISPVTAAVNWGMGARVWRACRVNGLRGGEEGAYTEKDLESS